jgi:hypothetical protein
VLCVCVCVCVLACVRACVRACVCVSLSVRASQHYLKGEKSNTHTRARALAFWHSRARSPARSMYVCMSHIIIWDKYKTYDICGTYIHRSPARSLSTNVRARKHANLNPNLYKICVCMYVCIYIYTYMYVCMYVCIHYMYIHIICAQTRQPKP